MDYDEYEDVAEDWELEAQLEEEREAREQAEREARAEKKLKTRAPTTKKEEEEVVAEETTPDDVQREMDRMRQIAQDLHTGASLMKDSETLLIADEKADTKEDARRVGGMIAAQLRTYTDSCNFDLVVQTLLESISHEFKTIEAINGEFTAIETALEASKKRAKEEARAAKEAAAAAEAAARHADPAVPSGGALEFAVEDRGGAEVEDNENPW